MFLQSASASADESEVDEMSSGEEYVPCSASDTETDSELERSVTSPLDESTACDKTTLDATICDQVPWTAQKLTIQHQTQQKTSPVIQNPVSLKLARTSASFVEKHNQKSHDILKYMPKKTWR